jgi:hypothetical protein
MWRGPLAYGQAGATRIFCGDAVSARSSRGRRRALDHTNGRRGDQEDATESGEEREDDCRRAVRGRRHDDAGRAALHCGSSAGIRRHGTGGAPPAGHDRPAGAGPGMRRCSPRCAPKDGTVRHGVAAKRGRAPRGRRGLQPRAHGTRTCRDREGRYRRGRSDVRRVGRRRCCRGRRGGRGPRRSSGCRCRCSCRCSCRCGRGRGCGRRRGRGSGDGRCRSRSGGRRSSCGRRGRRRRRRGAGEEPQRIEVALVVGGRAHAEVDVRHGELRRTARPDRADDRAFDDGAAARDRDRAEMREADREAVGGLDRHALPARRHGAGEADRARRGRHDGRGVAAADRDPSMLARGVWMRAVERERLQHRPLDRPCPPHGERDDEQHEEERDESPHGTPPLLSEMKTRCGR